MKKSISIIFPLFASILFFTECSSPNENKTAVNSAESIFDSLTGKNAGNYFSVSLQATPVSFKLPALQSFASASYHNYWILIGGQKYGFHGTSNNPAPFKSTVANDSIWVIDINNNRSWGAPVPQQYAAALSSSNPSFYQVDSFLFYSGGYTVSSSTAKNYDCTSDWFFEINLPQLIKYVQNPGTQPVMQNLFPIAFEDPYVQVTGGEMFQAGRYIYLIGGQNYNDVYSSGKTGIYTNAIRRFSLTQSGTSWRIYDTLSIIDPINLHRRDLNLVPFIVNNQLNAILYGGVFTKQDGAFRNPIYLSGFSSGTVKMVVDTTQLNANQYSCANIPLWINSTNPMFAVFLGGISYTMYDTTQGKVVVGDHGMSLPFSNLISTVTTDGFSFTTESIQLPPIKPLMPGYLGSNAVFFPVPNYLADGYQNILDVKKIFPSSPPQPAIVGYMYGGILSMGPTSGTTPKGHVNTYPNPALYKVTMSWVSQK
ncbi:MAG: hypothetical protein K0S44_592 [Bacteroidetes bacterium]|jgi:hypothetical protein|nr:hypothetical protein [Bacteroidota bacterium]